MGLSHEGYNSWTTTSALPVYVAVHVKWFLEVPHLDLTGGEIDLRRGSGLETTQETTLCTIFSGRTGAVNVGGDNKQLIIVRDQLPLT